MAMRDNVLGSLYKAIAGQAAKAWDVRPISVHQREAETAQLDRMQAQAEAEQLAVASAQNEYDAQQEISSLFTPAEDGSTPDFASKLDEVGAVYGKRGMVKELEAMMQKKAQQAQALQDQQDKQLARAKVLSDYGNSDVAARLLKEAGINVGNFKKPEKPAAQKDPGSAVYLQRGNDVKAVPSRDLATIQRLIEEEGYRPYQKPSASGEALVGWLGGNSSDQTSGASSTLTNEEARARLDARLEALGIRR
jgi:hypothetical protein